MAQVVLSTLGCESLHRLHLGLQKAFRLEHIRPDLALKMAKRCYAQLEAKNVSLGTKTGG